MKLIHNYKRVKSAINTLALSLLFSPLTRADSALPTAPGSNHDSGKEGYTGKLLDYAGDGILGLLLLMGVGVLIRVGANLMTTYGKISDKQATYKDLALDGVIGVVVLSFVMYLLIEAAEIFGISF